MLSKKNIILILTYYLLNSIRKMRIKMWTFLIQIISSLKDIKNKKFNIENKNLINKNYNIFKKENNFFHPMKEILLNPLLKRQVYNQLDSKN
jgi:hypothetical protein